MSNADMFDLDCEINKQTEMKREEQVAKHEQKIRHMVNKKPEEKKSNKVKENTDATVLKTNNDDQPKQDSSPSICRNNGWKSNGAVNRQSHHLLTLTLIPHFDVEQEDKRKEKIQKLNHQRK